MSWLGLSHLRLRWSRRWANCGGLRGDSGNALVEVALTISLLGIPLMAGTAQMGMIVYYSIEVADAAKAGATYGMQSLTTASNTSGMTSAAQAEASDIGPSLSVTPSSYYACSLAINGTQYTGTNAQTNATSACTGGTNHPLEFVKVATSATIAPLIHCPGLPKTFTLNGLSVMEVEP
jgi:Flp pilus assembly protein TadG